MKVKTLDNELVNWVISGNTFQNKSSYHNAAREVIKKVYLTAQILEEVSIPLYRGKTLYLDFYLPLYKMAFEIHGEQHYKFIAHFHKDVRGFAESRKRDLSKIEWCRINNIKVIELSYNETEEEWLEKLLS